MLYNFYSVPRYRSQDGGLMIYKSGWHPYRIPQQQAGGSFLSALTSTASSVGKALKPLAKTLKPVAAKVGKN